MTNDERNKNGRFKPGHKGGPGRPPIKHSISDMLRKLGKTEISDGKGRKRPRLNLMLETVYDLAIGGTSWAVQFIADRTEGRVPITSTEPEESESVTAKQMVEFLKAVSYGVNKPGGEEVVSPAPTPDTK